MYQLAIQRDFIAQHFLIGGDWGPENDLHSHHYQVEVILLGAQLDQHGYLVDIVDLEREVESLIERYQEKTLNSLPEFESLNPSLEHFVRIFAHELARRIHRSNLTSMSIKLWENDIAWASYQLTLDAD